jgi:predicted NUDIX family phosphoesterase
MENEEVLVLPEKFIKGLEPGFNTDPDFVNNLVNTLDKAFYLDRSLAEVNEKNKQIIPYILIRHKDKILAYKRATSSGETRLHEKWSIGIGGHINPIDGEDATNALDNAVSRELNEELSIDTDIELNSWVLGTLYDSSNSVGRVHLGIVINLMLEDEQVPEIKLEKTIDEIKWLTVEEINQLPNLENWSKMIVNLVANG